MRKAAELTVFGALAIGLHLLLLAEYAEDGAEAGGAGGEALVSIQASSAQIETMVESWTRPRQAAAAAPVIAMPPAPDSPLPDVPQIAAAAAPNAAYQVAALVPPRQPEQLTIDTETAPPPEPEPAPKLQPKRQAKPSHAAQTATAASPQQRSAGSGGSAQAGLNGTSDVRALSPGKEASLTARWGARIRSQIERQKRAMRGTRAAGRAIVRVTVAKDGHLQGVRLIRSSGNPALDGEALATVQRVRKFAAAPKELPKPAYSFDLPIKFGG